MAEIRRSVKKVTVTFLFVTVTFCQVYSAEPLISQVALSQKVIDLSKEEKAAINFRLSEKAQVDLKIYDEENALIRELKGEKTLKKGKHAIAWDGLDQEGEQVVSGVYIYVLEARGKSRFLYDPRDQTGGEEVFVENLSWDVKKSVIKYLLPKASYVRIRIGLKDGVFLGTLQDWSPLEAGEKELPWEGRDLSGHFDLTKHPEAQINISAFALPDNAIIVKNDAPPKKGTGTILSFVPVPFLDVRGRQTYIHARHPRSLCHEPRFQVEFPSMEKGTGKIPVRIMLDPRDKNYLVANRFEIMLFVDQVFLFEQEEGTSPLTIDLDSKRLGPGDHLLTINIMDYEDHVGVQTLKAKVLPVEQESSNV